MKMKKFATCIVKTYLEFVLHHITNKLLNSYSNEIGRSVSLVHHSMYAGLPFEGSISVIGLDTQGLISVCCFVLHNKCASPDCCVGQHVN